MRYISLEQILLEAHFDIQEVFYNWYKPQIGDRVVISNKQYCPVEDRLEGTICDIYDNMVFVYIEKERDVLAYDKNQAIPLLRIDQLWNFIESSGRKIVAIYKISSKYKIDYSIEKHNGFVTFKTKEKDKLKGMWNLACCIAAEQI